MLSLPTASAVTEDGRLYILMSPDVSDADYEAMLDLVTATVGFEQQHESFADAGCVHIWTYALAED